MQMISLRDDLEKEAPAALQVEVLSELEDFRALGGEWDRLLDESDQCVFFLRWHWNWLWWRDYAPPHSRLFLLTCRDGAGRLVGLAPCYWRQHRTLGIKHAKEILFLGTGTRIKTSEYLDLIARRGQERAVAEAIAGCLARRLDWDRLWLWHVPAASSILPHFRRAMGAGARIKVCDRAPYIDTDTGWAAFKQGLSQSRRRIIDYYPRRLFKHYDCSFKLVESEEELSPAMDALVRLHQARWEARGEPGSFRLPRFESFLKDVARSSLAEGRLRLWTLAINRQMAAVLIAFFDNGVVHFFQKGFDPAYFKDHLGKALLGLCIRDCVEDGEVREFDFMGGGAQYKELWTKSWRENIELEFVRPNLRSDFFCARERFYERAPALVRALTPAPLRAARRRLIQRWRTRPRAEDGNEPAHGNEHGNEQTNFNR